MSYELSHMSTKKYYPILKTTVSEMRALRQLEQPQLEKMTPIFELTKSRKTKFDKNGDVNKRIAEIVDIVGTRQFILDMTSEQSLENDQIVSMTDDFNYFENWRDFIDTLVDQNIAVIPVIQAYDDTSEVELEVQMEHFSQKCGSFALRIKRPFFDFEVAQHLLNASSKYPHTLIVDSEFVEEENFSAAFDATKSFILKAPQLPKRKVVVVCSSFPAIVNHGNKFEGSFSIEEREFTDKLAASLNRVIHHGDYGSVHPFRNEVTAYNWVPRIDYPLEKKVIYFRKQREAGGYKDCAERLVKNPLFNSDYLQCWGTDEIKQASIEPNGRSPSYWISVRINLHITRMLLSI